MKNLIVIGVLILTSFLIMCSNQPGKTKPGLTKSDTTKVLCFYKDLYDGQVKTGIVTRLVKDSLMYIYADTLSNKEKKWSIDTSYIETVAVPVDSTRSKQLKIPIKDSTGKQNYIYYDVPAHKRFIRSGWDRVDTLLINGLKAQQ